MSSKIFTGHKTELNTVQGDLSMIKFIKKLFGVGSAEPTKPQETVREILTPQAKAVDFVVANATGNVPLGNSTATYIPPAKPVNKVKAIGETGAKAVAAATAPKPANKKRRPYRGNKNAGGTVAKVSEGATKGGNGSLAKVGVSPAKPKPAAPKAPTKKK